MSLFSTNGWMLRNRYNALLYVSGLGILLSSVVFYVNFRQHPPVFLVFIWDQLQFLKLGSGVNSQSITEWLHSVPTFIHVVGFTLLSISFVQINKRNIFAVSATWAGINVLFESMQSSRFDYLLGSYMAAGTFSWFDIATAIVAALFVASILIKLAPETLSSRTRRGYFGGRFVKLVSVLILTGGVVSILGSYHCEDSEGTDCYSEPNYDAAPVYMSYEELRNSSVRLIDDQPLTDNAKIYLYGDYLLVNSRNAGVHVYNNIDPSTPAYMGFINIPGNLDMAVRNGYLYADSYIDLVVLDLSTIGQGVNAQMEVYRIADVFPYDPYQSIPEDIWIGPIDQAKGVVIGYE